MKTIIQIQESLYQTLGIHTGFERRKVLIDEMAGLTNQKNHCFNCSGTCCTYSANSMQITPIEAFEILLSLNVNAENIAELKAKLKKNIQDYRLDHEIFLGKKKISTLRKTYTCPFFEPGPKGCTIKKDLKPYGCLGFNPRIENDNGGQCHSDLNLLDTREQAEKSNEEAANTFLKQELKLDWEKLEIPRATLKLLDLFFPG